MGNVRLTIKFLLVSAIIGGLVLTGMKILRSATAAAAPAESQCGPDTVFLTYDRTTQTAECMRIRAPYQHIYSSPAHDVTNGCSCKEARQLGRWANI